MDVLVINADLGPLHRVSLRHAVRMLVRQVAEVHESRPDGLIGVYPMPTVVRLVRYVVTKWRYSAVPGWSRAGVLVRDGRACGYCGGHATTDRPRPAPLPRRPEHLVQHHRGLRRLQPAQGRPHPGRGRDDPAVRADDPVVGVAHPALTAAGGAPDRRPHQWELM